MTGPSLAARAVEDLAETVARALAEDIGAGDVTGRLTVPEGARGRGLIVQKQAGVVYGLQVAELAFRGVQLDLDVKRLAPEGQWRDGGEVMAVEGDAAALLAAERTALNFLARLSGIATLTARCVAAVQGTGVRILDTRKTTPGLRLLEKAAVRAGGGVNHRGGLYDAVLIKENHAALAGSVGAAVTRARAGAGDLPIEVECRSLAEMDEALEAGAERILLDNLDPDQLRGAVEHARGRAALEASGGIGPENVRDFAATGVDFISIGALTHSAPALDLSLTLQPLA